jgi:hypothetical protein
MCTLPDTGARLSRASAVTRPQNSSPGTYAMKPTVKAFVRYTRFFRVVYPRKFRDLRQFRARAILRVRRLEGFFGVPKPDALARMCDRLRRVSGASISP